MKQVKPKVRRKWRSKICLILCIIKKSYSRLVISEFIALNTNDSALNFDLYNLSGKKKCDRRPQGDLGFLIISEFVIISLV